MIKQKYTIISSTYAGECPKRLEKYFETIYNQTVQPYEIILCIDGSIGENLHEVIQKAKTKLPLRIEQNAKQGLALNLRHALNLVKTEFTARCDTDDFFLDTRFERQLKFIKKNNVHITSCFAKEIFKNGSERLKLVPIRKLDKYSYTTYFKNPVNHHSAFFKTEPVRSINYSEGRMEDFRLWTQCLKSGLTIMNSNEVHVVAFADGLEKRRSGRDYRMAELQLLKMNLFRSPPLSIIFSLVSFSIRFPLRFKIMKSLLLIALGTTRRNKIVEIN